MHDFNLQMSFHTQTDEKIKLVKLIYITKTESKLITTIPRRSAKPITHHMSQF